MSHSIICDCGHPIEQHTYSDEFQGCDLKSCNCKRLVPNIVCEYFKELEVAARPFAHHDLCKKLSSNTEGDNSIIFQRDKAVITLGDCRRVAKFLEKKESNP